MDTIAGIICCLPDCNHVGKDICDLKAHLKGAHYLPLSTKSDGKFICKNIFCNSRYSKFDSFLNHVKSNHLKDGQFHFTRKTLKGPVEGTNQEKLKAPFDFSPLKIEGIISKMVADLRFSTSMTGADLGRCVDGTKQVVAEILGQVRKNITEYLNYKDIELNEIDKLVNTLTFQNTSSQYKTMKGQIAALKKNYHYIDPIQMSFSNTDGSSEATFQYISIIDTLKLVLSNHEVAEYMKNGPTLQDDEFIKCFEDGKTFKNHEFFKKFPNAFGIHLYNDDFLTNNPLGSKTHPHKISVLYFSISNHLPPHLRDFLGNVHVLGLAYAKDVAKYGMNQFLLPFFLDLQKLESDNGVQIKLKNDVHILHATIMSVCADTLAAHEVLGFMSPSAKYFCRFCMMSQTERKECPSEVAPRRTRKLHETHLKLIENDEKARTECGVKHDSILNKSKYFHCTCNWSEDTMHDILCGQGHYDLKLVIYKLIQTYDITVEMLNQRINAFKYGREEIKNKPSATLTTTGIRHVTTDHKLQESAAQMWCLLRIFPFLVADKVPEEDPYLNHIIRLNRINEYLFSPKLKPSNIIQLRDLIHNHIVSFSRLFPEENAINKLHHMDHYAECIENSGPLRHLTCFKYEAKHQLFKKYGAICCNYKNVIVSMANISQMTQCSIWGTNRSEIRMKIEENASAEVTSEIDPKLKEALKMNGLSINDKIKIVSRISYYGVQYATDSFVAIKCDPDNLNMPVFGKIEKIVLSTNEVYLFCKKYNSSFLSELLNSYCINEENEFFCIKIDELCDSKPYSSWSDFSADKRQYICLRHLLF